MFLIQPLGCNIINKVELSLHLTWPNYNKKAQLTLTNLRDAKACKNCSNLTCFVSFHRIPFPRISNYRCIASHGMF